jgi:mono/diheme cytochrome c family protein
LIRAIFIAQTAVAADANNGKRIALLRCAPCHVVTPERRKEVADSPPFETIGRKFGYHFELLDSALRDPHPRMNLMLTQREVEDLAAYISSLAK